MKNPFSTTLHAVAVRGVGTDGGNPQEFTKFIDGRLLAIPEKVEHLLHDNDSILKRACSGITGRDASVQAVGIINYDAES